MGGYKSQFKIRNDILNFELTRRRYWDIIEINEQCYIVVLHQTVPDSDNDKSHHNVSDFCLASREQFFSNINARTSDIL